MAKKEVNAATEKTADKWRDPADLPPELRHQVALRNGMTPEQIAAAVRAVAEANGLK